MLKRFVWGVSASLLVCITLCQEPAVLKARVSKYDVPAPDKRLVKRSDDALPLEVTVQQLSASMTDLQAKVDSLTSVVTHLQANAGRAVAFSVRYSADPVDDLGNGATLRFDVAMHNLGSSYNPATGIFTAPVAGLYVFFLQLMGSDTQGPMYLGIVKTGKVVLDQRYTEGSVDVHDQSAGLTTVHLAGGEQVWVRHIGGTTSVRGSIFTTFSGFLVHAD